jgi:amino acid transporter
MNERIFFEWSNDTIVTTIIYAIIIIASLLYLYKEYIDTDSLLKRIGAVAIAIFLVVANIYLTSMTPLYVKYNQREICIKNIIGRKIIPYSEIISIECIEPATISRSTRRMASDGAGGYVGLFNNKTIGNYYMYATQRSELVLVTTNDKKVVFNCSKRDNLVDYIKEKI